MSLASKWHYPIGALLAIMSLGLYFPLASTIASAIFGDKFRIAVEPSAVVPPIAVGLLAVLCAGYLLSSSAYGLRARLIVSSIYSLGALAVGLLELPYFMSLGMPFMETMAAVTPFIIEIPMIALSIVASSYLVDLARNYLGKLRR